MTSSSLALALALLSAGGGENEPKEPLQPIAVAPFANLNDDASLRWLEAGAAETIAVDLKRAGVVVVERAQIAEALAQVAAQSRDDVARAVAAGRIAGARSIVIGSFQRAGADVRLTARVVDVESGAVSLATKATGPLADIFRLQDAVVSGLLRKPAPVRKTAPSVPAYQKLAQSLSAPVDEQRALLEQSLAIDPAFSYARDALAALEARMRAADRDAAPALDARERALLAVVHDVKEPVARRQAAASAVIDALAGARRFHALSAACDAVLAEKLPSDVVDDVNERASSARVLSLSRLIRADQALAAGERYLAAYPAGGHRKDVEKLMHDVVDVRRTEPERRKEYDAELAEASSDQSADDVARAYHPCIAAKWSTLPDEMLAQCGRFLDAAPALLRTSVARDAATANDVRDRVVSARAFVAWAWALKGEFNKAGALAAALEAELPGALEKTGLRDVMDRWSTD